MTELKNCSQCRFGWKNVGKGKFTHCNKIKEEMAKRNKDNIKAERFQVFTF